MGEYEILKNLWCDGYYVGRDDEYAITQEFAIDKANRQLKANKGEDIVLRQDGDKWMCVKGDFIDLHASHDEVWWGDTPEQALVAYTTRPKPSDTNYFDLYPERYTL